MFVLRFYFRIGIVKTSGQKRNNKKGEEEGESAGGGFSSSLRRSAKRKVFSGFYALVHHFIVTSFNLNVMALQ